MEEELDPLNITGQPSAPILRMRGWRRGCRNTEPSKYYSTAASSNAEDERMVEGLEIILNPLNITGQPPALMLKMRGWRRGWRSY